MLMETKNHNPFAEDGPNAALDVLGPIWPSIQITPRRRAFNGDMSWLEYDASGLGRVVDRYRWEEGCIVEHVSPAVFTRLGFFLITLKWDQGETFPGGKV